MKVLALSLILLASFARPVVCAEAIAVIVNTDNSVSDISSADLADFYLKKKRQWPDGKQVRFIDRADKSGLRDIFLEIIKKSSRELDLYWIGQKLYAGDSSPQQVGSDSLAASLVARFPEAISYVSDSFAKANSNKRIKVIGIQ